MLSYSNIYEELKLTKRGTEGQIICQCSTRVDYNIVFVRLYEQERGNTEDEGKSKNRTRPDGEGTEETAANAIEDVILNGTRRNATEKTMQKSYDDLT